MGDKGGVTIDSRETLDQIRKNFQGLGYRPYLRGDSVVVRGWAEPLEGYRDIYIHFPDQELPEKSSETDHPITEWLELKNEDLNGRFIPWTRLRPSLEDMYGDPSDQNSLARKLEDWSNSAWANENGVNHNGVNQIKERKE